MLGTVRAVIALGSFAWAAALGALGRNGFAYRDRGRRSVTAPKRFSAVRAARRSG